MNWGSYSDIGTMVATWLTLVVAVVAVFLAWKGSEAWRTQLLGESKHRAAHGLLAAVYKVEQATLAARLRVIFVQVDEMPSTDRTGMRGRLLANVERFRRRLGPVATAQAELLTALQEARPVLSDVAVAVAPLQQIGAELLSAAEIYSVYAEAASEETPYRDELRDQVRIMYDVSTGKSPDEWGVRFRKAVEKVEVYASEFLNPKTKKSAQPTRPLAPTEAAPPRSAPPPPDDPQA